MVLIDRAFNRARSVSLIQGFLSFCPCKILILRLWHKRLKTCIFYAAEGLSKVDFTAASWGDSRYSNSAAVRGFENRKPWPF